MEDFRVDVIVGKGPGATAIPLELPPFTRRRAPRPEPGCSPPPLRDRFGFTGHLDYYDADDLVTILRRSAGLLGVEADEPTASPRSPAAPAARRASPTACCAGCATGPRSTATGTSTTGPPSRPSRSSTSTTRGLDRLDRAVLEALCRRFGGGPVGLSTLAVAVGEESDTVETVAEPYLVREGFIVRTPRGRAAAAARLAPPRPRAAAQRRRCRTPSRWTPGRARPRRPVGRAGFTRLTDGHAGRGAGSLVTSKRLA